MTPFSLRGRVALVTGAGGGIGAAIARRLAQAGAAVMLANRTLATAEAQAQQLRTESFQAQATGFEASPSGAAAAVAATVAAFNGLDILVHNAGGCPWASLDDLDDATLRKTLDLNLLSCFWLTQAALPHLRVRGGRILITSSVTGPRSAMLDCTHYAAAKAGVNGFIRAAALELAKDRITVNGVEPGVVGKDHGRLSQPALRARIAEQIPLGRLGQPDDIAAAMLYLASDEACWVTGQTLIVDGGASLPESGFVMDEVRARSHPEPNSGD